MFVPDDLSVDEEALHTTIRRQMLDHRRPQSQTERQAVLAEADQVAAEMIQAARAETWEEEPPVEPETENERWWANLRQEVANLDRSWGSIEAVAAMEDEGASRSEWLPVGAHSPPTVP